MVISRITQALNKTDEKYEFLLHKYTSLQSENKKLKKIAEESKEKAHNEEGMKFAKELISVYEKFEQAKDQSFKVNATSPDLQRFLIDFNATGKEIDKIMKKNGIELYDAKERFYDVDLHKVSAYQEANGMQKGIILKTTRKGCKYKNKIVKKPRVVVTQ